MQWRGQTGFSLVELLVVILIIGILATLAIPRFLGQRNSAQDAKAKNAVRSALSAAESYYTTRNETFAGLTPNQLKAIEPSLYDGTVETPAASAEPGASADPSQIAVIRFDGTLVTNSSGSLSASVTLCSLSRAESIFCIFSEHSRSGTPAVYYRRFQDDGSAQFSLGDADGAGASTLPPCVGAGCASGWSTRSW